MATKEEILNCVVKPLTSNYGAIKGDPEAFRDLLCRTLESYSPILLDRAVERIVTTRRYKTWPTIGDIVEAVKKAGGKDTERSKFPTPMRDVTAENFWELSGQFVQRDFDARGTCLVHCKKGTYQWESWSIYLEKIGLRPAFLKNLEWYSPCEWPWQFDTEKGQDCQPPIDFIEYIPYEYKPSPEIFGDQVEDREKISSEWAKLRETMLKEARKSAII